ncbi:MAG TPA: hypothetical protein VKV28_01955 [Candidatus Binataceae bacterium]|nr:hypothetical protein [Candidatus Binataceae bacterium]
MARPALLMLAAALICAAACSTVLPPELAQPVSHQKLTYYPGLVKGFEHSYPPRTMLVLPVIDNCLANAPSDGAANGEHQVGVTTDGQGNVLQRLYLGPIAAQVQSALVAAADEAGLRARPSDRPGYDGQSAAADYVVQSEVTQCSLKKNRINVGDLGPNWQTVANFSLSVTIYKPPFRIPFWQGSSAQTYTDPPDTGSGLDEDAAQIYDQPGQVLSVAFTRGVEGIFARPDLHELISDDRVLRPSAGTP